MFKNKQDYSLASAEMSEKAYEEFVAGRFAEAERSADPIIFTNRGPQHARTVLNQLVSRAATSLDILTGHLSTEVYDQASLTPAIERVNSVRVIVTDADLARTAPSALSGMRRLLEQGKLLVRHYPAFVMVDERRIPLNHFAIGDKRHVRAENDAVNRSATVILNGNTDKAHNLANLYCHAFDTLWKVAQDWRPTTP